MIPERFLWFFQGVLFTLAFQAWLRIRHRKARFIANGRRLANQQSHIARLMAVSRTHGHTWDLDWGGVCSGCRKDLHLPGVADQECIPAHPLPSEAS